MDLDAYVQAKSSEWTRLDQLVKANTLTGAEADELIDRYQRVATHLSVIQSSAPDPGVIAYLSSLLSRARNRAEGTRTGTWRGAGRFFTRRFPAALYRMRAWWLGTVAGCVVVTGVMMLWLLANPTVEQTLLSPDEVDQLVNSDFESYYSESASQEFALQVWINNAWVAAFCIVLGTLGLPVLYLLFQNLLNLAVIGAVMINNDRGSLFWGLILPHGLLELTAVFVAGGVGLRLFWSWIEPGDRTRAASFAAAGRTAITVAVGLVAVLLLSGLIEGFVTGSALPTWARVTIGVAAEALFFAYVFILGRNAALEGETGDIDVRFLEDRVASAS